MHARLISLVMGTTFALSGCTMGKNDEAVNAKVAEERLKDYQTQIVELKATNEKLNSKVTALESEVTQLKDRLVRQARTATAEPTRKKAPAEQGKSKDKSEKASPSDIEALREDMKGAGGFK